MNNNNKLLTDYSNFLVSILAKEIQLIKVKNSDINIILKQNTNLIKIMTFLSKHTNSQFKSLIDIVGIDYLVKKKRFKVVYNILSFTNNCRIFLHCSLDKNLIISSVSSLYKNAT